MKTKTKKRRQEEFEYIECCSCSVGFYITAAVHYRESTFYCPNGHGLINTKVKEEKKAREKSENKKEADEFIKEEKQRKILEDKRISKLPIWKQVLANGPFK